jgi:hypothetical protein
MMANDLFKLFASKLISPSNFLNYPTNSLPIWAPKNSILLFSLSICQFFAKTLEEISTNNVII